MRELMRNRAFGFMLSFSILLPSSQIRYIFRPCRCATIIPWFAMKSLPRYPACHMAATSAVPPTFRPWASAQVAHPRATWRVPPTARSVIRCKFWMLGIRSETQLGHYHQIGRSTTRTSDSKVVQPATYKLQNVWYKVIAIQLYRIWYLICWIYALLVHDLLDGTCSWHLSFLHVSYHLVGLVGHLRPPPTLLFRSPFWQANCRWAHGKSISQPSP